MPDLPDVEQTFRANVAPYVAALKAAAAAAKDFAEQNDKLAASMLLTGGASKVLQQMLDSLEQSEMYASDTAELLNLMLRSVRDTEANVAMQSALLFEQLNRLNDSMSKLLAISLATRSAVSSLGDAFSGVAGKAGAAAGATTLFGLALGAFGTVGNAVHWIIAGLAEFLAVAIPAAIAAAVGAFVLYQGVVEQVGTRLQSLYTVTEATSQMIGKTAGDVLGLGHAFQTAQNAANPIAYELLGEYINGARASMTSFASAGLQVAQMIGQLGAKIAVDLNNNAARFASLLSAMVPDLQKFGQIFGDLGHALLNFASDMPGLAEVLLTIADAISKVILWISQLPPWIITAAMAFEEFNRWGGLAIGILSRLGLTFGTVAPGILSVTRAVSILRAAMLVIPTILFNVGAALSMFGGRIPLIGAGLSRIGSAMAGLGNDAAGAIAGLGGFEIALIAIAAVGAGILIDKMITAQSAIQAFGASLQKNIAASSNIAALGAITNGFAALNANASKLSPTVNDTARALERENQAAGQAATATVQLSAVQKQLISDSTNLFSGADKISRAYGTTFAQSLALADAAGVKLSTTEITLGKNANVAGMQIQSLVLGYKQLDQTGGILANDMNAVAVAAGLQASKVGQLNQAWDQFMSNSTGLTSSLATLNQDLTQIGNVGVAVGQRFQTFSGTTKIAIDAAAQALTSFSGKGAQVWQNYDAALQQAETWTDNLRIAAAYGGVQQQQYTGMIANTVAALLPFASKSQIAVQQLSVLAQEAGGPATSNFTTLKNWVDQNGISATQFAKDMNTAAAALGNAGSAARQFAGDLQSQMQARIASALLSQSSLNSAVQNFQRAVLAAGGQISSSSPQFQALYKMLIAAGLSASQARAEMKLLQASIDALHSKTITITVNTVYHTTGSATGAALSSGSSGGMKPGLPQGLFHGGYIGAQHGLVTGPSGVDIIPTMLTAGEAVLNAAAVMRLGGPMGIHNLNNQPSEAVLGHGPSGVANTVLGLNLVVQNRMDNQVVNNAQRRETLIYNRRNSSNQLALRTR